MGGVAGLYLRIKDSGARSWALRIVVGDRRREIGLGGYPTVSLEQARQRAREVREEVWQGVDPVAAKRTRESALKAEQAKVLTFDEAAGQCHQTKLSEFRNRKHGKDWISSLDRYASPVIGKLPVAEIDLAHIVKVLRPIWRSRTETCAVARAWARGRLSSRS